MMGQRYLPTNIQVLNFEHDHTIHQKKLGEIQQTEPKKKVVVDKDLQSKKQLNEVRERNLKFHNSEKALAIEKDNQLLLGKLVEISRKKKPNLFPLKSDTFNAGSLNGPSRRREKDRIAQENEAFARRLLSQQPSFNRRKLENDYERHNERVKNMQRLAALSPRARKVKLPPLTRDEKTDVKAKSTDDRKNTKTEKKNGITRVQEENEGDQTGDENTKAELDNQNKESQRRESEAAKTKLEADAKAKSEADAQAKAFAEVRAKADAEAEAQVKGEAEDQVKADADAKAKADADADAKAKAAAEADVKAKADADAKVSSQNTSQVQAQDQASPNTTSQQNQSPTEQPIVKQADPEQVKSPTEQGSAQQQNSSVAEGQSPAGQTSQRASVVSGQGS